MTTHPSSIDLEAFACGDAIDAVRTHVGECAACRAFVERMSAEQEAFKKKLTRVEVDRAALRPERAARRTTLRTIAWTALPVLSVAAATILFLRFSPGPAPAPSAEAWNTSPSESVDEPGTTFKGGVQVAVIRDRKGEQKRFVGQVPVRPGDRLRIEVALDRSATVVGGVMTDDGKFLSLMPEKARASGTHFSEEAARFDDDPTTGFIIVGTPDAVAKTRQTHARDGVASIRVLWESR